MSNFLILRKTLTFQDLPTHLECLLSEGEIPDDNQGSADGRLGPSTVVLDHTSGFEGLLFVDDDLLGVIGHSNFSSIRATTCVFKGKWVYEVLISSQGLMQIGWCTLNCRFNQEEGVGDTPDSYAYDGNRVSWTCCLIDLDEGTITFCLNGQSLGTAFSNIKMGPGIAFFPAISLSFKESVAFNFGSRPLRYPPLISSNKLLGYIKNVLCTAIDSQEEKLIEKSSSFWQLQGEPTVLVTLVHIFNHFAPLMIHYLRLTTAILHHENYVTFDVLRSVVFFYIKTPLRVKEAGLEELIPTTWWPTQFDKEGKDERNTREESADERLRRRAYERGCQRLKKRIEVVEELQIQILRLMLNSKDKGTGEASRYIFLNKFRKFLQENASNRANPTVLCPPEYMVCFLHRLITAVRSYWDEGKKKIPDYVNSEEAYVPPQLFYNGKVDYFDLQRLGGLLSHLKKTLKDDLAFKANIIIDPAELQATSMDDLDEDEESGAAQALRPFGSATATGGALTRPSWLSSPTLGRANRFLSTAAVSLMTPRRPLTPPEKVKVRMLAVEQRTEQDIEGSPGNDGLLLGRPLEEPDQPITEKSLLEILDGIVLMYNLSVHQQLGKMVVVSDDVHEYAVALKDTEEKIARCPSRRVDILEELQKSQKVFAEKLNHLSRRLAWINATIYSKEKMFDIYWLLRVCIRTIEHADNTGSLFAFTPEFYLSVAMNSYSALKNYFSSANSMEDLPGYEDTLTQLAAILAKHFADPRIVGTDMKDSLMQALASYVCYPQSLRAVERISEDQRVAMMKNLLAPYEQRPWAQTNWILVRLWRVSYIYISYVLHLSNALIESDLQSVVTGTVLLEHFLNSVLNQLNWAFSEFIGMIQEVKNKILLRVLEMTVTLVSEIFLDWSRPSAELLLRRLAQLLNQVLNRVTAERNLFDRVVNLRLPGLESVDHYPILVAVTGILVCILMDSERRGAAAVLLSDPCFQLHSIQHLLGAGESDVAGADRKHFSLHAYKDYISAEEAQKVGQMLDFLTDESKQAAASTPTSEEDLCPICYAHSISAIFKPCSHKSCKERDLSKDCHFFKVKRVFAQNKLKTSETC
uniref:SPRY domain-containing protein n=1 Tax=Denticeps clupeoides TaxID=299321 RepID=A0AAY4AXJ6_9TELE